MGEKEKEETCMLDVEEKPVCAQYIREIVQEQFIHVKNTTPSWLPNSVRPSMISYVSANPITSNSLEAVSISTPHFFSKAAEHLREMLFACLGQTLPFFSACSQLKKKK